MKTPLSTLRILTLGIVLLSPSCGGTQPPVEAPSPSPSEFPTGHPSLPDDPPDDTESFEGVVQEVIESGGYTYVRLETDGGEIWAAGPRTSLVVGAQVQLVGASAMGDFTSTSLGRTFDEIYFVGSFIDATPPEDGIRGVVVQVMSGGGYTYVEAEVDGNRQWLAATETEVAEGQSVVWVGGTEMGQFHSRILDRTFDNILFVARLWVVREKSAFKEGR